MYLEYCYRNPLRPWLYRLLEPVQLDLRPRLIVRSNKCSGGRLIIRMGSATLLWRCPCCEYLDSWPIIQLSTSLAIGIMVVGTQLLAIDRREVSTFEHVQYLYLFFISTPSHWHVCPHVQPGYVSPHLSIAKLIWRNHLYSYSFVKSSYRCSQKTSAHYNLNY